MEYGAIAITARQLLTCQGAQAVLTGIENDGMSVDSILYRKNGLIHLNLRQTGGQSQGYSNYYLTLRLENGSVTLIDQGMGYYLKAMTGIPVDYPAVFPEFNF